MKHWIYFLSAIKTNFSGCVGWHGESATFCSARWPEISIIPPVWDERFTAADSRLKVSQAVDIYQLNLKSKKLWFLF